MAGHSSLRRRVRRRRRRVGFDSTFLGLLGLAMVLLSILVWWLYYRCPQCHESLGRGNPKHCPHCGAWLGNEPEPEEKKKIQHKKKRR